MHPLDRLAAGYEDRLGVLPDAVAGRPAVACVGAEVPIEVLAAAGLHPIRLSGSGEPDDQAAQYCGRGIDDVAVSRLGRVLRGDVRRCGALVVSADCEGSLRLYFALRELLRLEPHPEIPRLILLDLRHLSQRSSTTYNRQRFARFVDRVRSLSSAAVTDADLLDAAARQDRVRELVRRVGTELRAHPGGPRISGEEALAVIGASFVLDADTWCALTQELLDHAAELPVRAGPRIFLTGSSHEDPAVYRRIEAAGATIVGEDHDWGALVGQRGIGRPHDIASGIVAAYVATAPGSPAAGAVTRAEQTMRMAAECDADVVLAWTRHYDDAPPWDIPLQRDTLAAAGIPFAVLPASRYGADDATLTDTVGALLSDLAAGHQQRTETQR